MSELNHIFCTSKSSVQTRRWVYKNVWQVVQELILEVYYMLSMKCRMQVTIGVKRQQKHAKQIHFCLSALMYSGVQKSLVCLSQKEKTHQGLEEERESFLQPIRKIVRQNLSSETGVQRASLPKTETVKDHWHKVEPSVEAIKGLAMLFNVKVRKQLPEV